MVNWNTELHKHPKKYLIDNIKLDSHHSFKQEGYDPISTEEYLRASISWISEREQERNTFLLIM